MTLEMGEDARMGGGGRDEIRGKITDTGKVKKEQSERDLP